MLKTFSKEQFQQAMFPTLETMKIFKDLVEYNQHKIETITSYSQGQQKFNAAKNFILKLKEECNFDLVFDNLYDDQYTITQKIGSHKFPNNIVEKIDSGEHIEYQKLCDEYGKQYERMCKRYFKPLILIISSQKKSCGKCIEELKKFDPKLEQILKPFISHIRNSINHSDFYKDIHKNIIIFEDENKPIIEKTEEDMKLLLKQMVESELAMSAAESYVKTPFHKVIIEDSEKVLEYCKILGMDYTELLKEFVSQGYSIFQLKFALERIINEKKFHNLR